VASTGNPSPTTVGVDVGSHDVCVPKVIGVKQFRKWRCYTKLGILEGKKCSFCGGRC
jgi:hypothetical protein